MGRVCDRVRLPAVPVFLSGRVAEIEGVYRLTRKLSHPLVRISRPVFSITERVQLTSDTSTKIPRRYLSKKHRLRCVCSPWFWKKSAVKEGTEIAGGVILRVLR